MMSQLRGCVEEDPLMSMKEPVLMKVEVETNQVEVLIEVQAGLQHSRPKHTTIGFYLRCSYV